MFSIYNKVTRGSLITNVFYFYCIFFCFPGSCFFFSFFSFISLLFKSIYFLFYFSSSYCLFKAINYIITIIIITIIVSIIIIVIMLINTVTGILEKSSGGGFQARHSSDMVYSYSAR